jgi:hypothetical protein
VYAQTHAQTHGQNLFSGQRPISNKKYAFAICATILQPRPNEKIVQRLAQFLLLCNRLTHFEQQPQAGRNKQDTNWHVPTLLRHIVFGNYKKLSGMNLCERAIQTAPAGTGARHVG